MITNMRHNKSNLTLNKMVTYSLTLMQVLNSHPYFLLKVLSVSQMIGLKGNANGAAGDVWYILWEEQLTMHGFLFLSDCSLLWSPFKKQIPGEINYEWDCSIKRSINYLCFQ